MVSEGEGRTTYVIRKGSELYTTSKRDKHKGGKKGGFELKTVITKCGECVCSGTHKKRMGPQEWKKRVGVCQ